MKLSLKTYTVSEEVFNNILQYYDFTEYHQVLDKYLSGYSNRHYIYYNDSMLIIRRRQLSILYPDFFNKSDDDKDLWYQVALRKEIEQSDKFIEDTSVIKAVAGMNSVLKKRYTEKEIDTILRNHESEDSEILHVSIKSQRYKILKFENCYYYDINSAYGSELRKLFPKCAKDIDYMYKHKKDNNGKYKKWFNYWVGCLTMNEKKKQKKIELGQTLRTDYSKSRNYIVNNITIKLYGFIKSLNGEANIYTNTDGTIIQNPKFIPQHSDKMGCFKLEYHGDVYTYQDKNYTIVQYGDEIKGTLPIELRKYVDLRKGQVVRYVKHVYPDKTYKILDLEVVNIYEEK